MNKYRDKNSGVVYSEYGLRKLFSTISIPKKLTQEVCESLGLDIVYPSIKPSCDITKIAIEDGAELSSDGTWVVKWLIKDRFSDYVDEDGTTITKDQLDAKYLEDTTQELSNQARADRNRLLLESDWTQIADAPVDKTAWAAYRKALRDITTHANFPNLQETDWPIKPE